MDKILNVYIITYNRSSMLKDAIKSVLSQTYKNFDLYILDNASTDDTESVVKSFTDTRLHYIKHDTNIGGTNNINFAISHNEREFFSIFHDDDIEKNNILEKEIDCLINDKSIVAVTSGVDVIDKNKNFLYDTSATNSSIKIFKNDEYFVNYITKFQSLCFPTTMYRNSFIKNNNIRLDNNVGPCTDVILYATIGRHKGIIKSLPDRLLMYRSHEKQDSNLNFLPMHISLFNYIKNDNYFNKLFIKYKKGQNFIYRTLSISVFKHLLKNKISINTASNYLVEINNLFVHSFILHFIFKIFFLIYKISPRTLFFIFDFYHNIKKK